MPSPVKITLSHEEKKQLEKNITSRKTAVRLVERSKIILLAADNVPNYRIALQLGIGVNKVGRWRNRYAERGMQGIEKDLPRGANHGGKDTAEQAKLRSKIIKMTTQEKPKDGTHWSTRGLAKVLGINHSFVNRVWREAGLKPHLNVINLSLTVFFDTASGTRVLGLFSCLSGTCVLDARPLPHRPYAAITARKAPVAKFPGKA